MLHYLFSLEYSAYSTLVTHTCTHTQVQELWVLTRTFFVFFYSHMKTPPIFSGHSTLGVHFFAWSPSNITFGQADFFKMRSRS